MVVRVLSSELVLLRVYLVLAPISILLSLLVAYRDPDALISISFSPLFVQISAAPATFFVLAISLALVAVSIAIPITRHLGHK